jgi:hypothetical protein
MAEQIPVALGTRVEIELIGKDKTRERLQCVLVDDAAADFEKGFLSANTPLAQTLLGHAAGETLAYPRGDIVQVKILAVQPQAHTPASDAGEQRDEALRRARDKAELANMVSFALTFDSKWGDYDPEQIVKQYEEQEDQAKGEDK